MRVLILEDEYLLAVDLAHAVAEAGHEVVGVHGSASEARAALDAGVTPDLLLTNIDLDISGSGVDVAREFARRGVPSIFVSGSRKKANAARDVALGILVKPCRADQIAASIEAVWRALAGETDAQAPEGLEIFAEGIEAHRSSLKDAEASPARRLRTATDKG